MTLFTKKQARLCRIITLAVILATGLNAESKTLFPMYPSIQPNVLFWQKVYSRYTTRQGILHDKDHPDIIYTVIDLVDWGTMGSGRINKKLIKMARWKYRTVLAHLGSGKKPATDEEKRVAAMFPTKSRLAFLKAQNNIRLQIGQKDRFRQGVIRSGAYISSIKKIFITYGLPAELAYLPHVESSFNPKAHSKAGAVGLWQFTRSTGRQYMTIDSAIDERYDLLMSTRAAACLLKNNYELLGSWPLALTAYNYGPAGMARALREKKSYENIFKKHQARRFKFASRNFYPEFLAALRVAKRLEKDPGLIQDRPAATLSVRLKGFMRASDIRSHFGISKEDFALLNPALKKSVLTGRKYIPAHFLVRVPANSRTQQLAENIPPRLYHAKQIRDCCYFVVRGDTAGSIARKYHITVAKLIHTNNLNRRATIRIGQKLTIPGKAPAKNKKNIVLLKTRSKNKPY